ncbi:hypothetical protein GTQ34_07410 [Muricauda sp. JGD-17]|uniref:YtxH domain-containing protein n=1 Tax=Flagellimonas ochracea TaxID=2696472 RepID=A0A964TCI0_9FLAO|nr:hypothetical protein [Allomuricauda ochracea]NAY91739.1 hypothetical protein [Allomuricauda ochracea]
MKKSISLFILFIALAFSLTNCRETKEEKAEDAIEEVEDGIEEAGEEVEDAAKDVEEEIDGAIDDN